MLQSLSYLCGPRNTTYTSIHNCTDIGQFVQQQENVEDKLYVGQAGLSEAVWYRTERLQKSTGQRCIPGVIRM